MGVVDKTTDNNMTCHMNEITPFWSSKLGKMRVDKIGRRHKEAASKGGFPVKNLTGS